MLVQQNGDSAEVSAGMALPVVSTGGHVNTVMIIIINAFNQQQQLRPTVLAPPTTHSAVALTGAARLAVRMDGAVSTWMIIILSASLRPIKWSKLYLNLYRVVEIQHQ